MIEANFSVGNSELLTPIVCQFKVVSFDMSTPRKRVDGGSCLKILNRLPTWQKKSWTLIVTRYLWSVGGILFQGCLSMKYHSVFSEKSRTFSVSLSYSLDTTTIMMCIFFIKSTSILAISAENSGFKKRPLASGYRQLDCSFP